MTQPGQTPGNTPDPRQQKKHQVQWAVRVVVGIVLAVALFFGFRHYTQTKRYNRIVDDYVNQGKTLEAAKALEEFIPDASGRARDEAQPAGQHSARKTGMPNPSASPANPVQRASGSSAATTGSTSEPVST